MKPRVFLDTNVFIYAFEYPNSNSAVVIQLLNRNEIEAVISERVLSEVVNYFKKYYNKDLASLFRLYLLEACFFVPTRKVRETMEQYRHKIKEKDLNQLAVVKQHGIKYLVAYDEDFEPFEEYITPKEFIREIGKEPRTTEY